MTPEEKFKQERREYYNLKNMDRGHGDRVITDDEINEYVDQEWQDYIDGLDEIASRSM